MNSDNIKDTKGIKAMLVLEIIGRPPEHVKETLEKIIGEIDKEQGCNVTNKKINEPVLMKDQKDLYTTFAEVEVEVEQILHLVVLMFKYMPAHIEVIEPEMIVLNNNGWNDILNELTRRLHGYDEVARILQLQNKEMEKKLNEMGVKVEREDESKN